MGTDGWQHASKLFEGIFHTATLLAFGQLDARFKLMTNGLEPFFWCHHTPPVQQTYVFGIPALLDALERLA